MKNSELILGMEVIDLSNIKGIVKHIDYPLICVDFNGNIRTLNADKLRISLKSTLTITSKVPRAFKDQYTGVCLTEDGTLYFGWRGKSKDNLCFTVGNAIQKAIPLMQRHGYNEVIINIDPEFTEYQQPAKLRITLC